MPDWSPASTKNPSDQGTIDLAGFVSSVPTPLTITLVRLSPHITWIRRTIEITSWRSSWEESWLLIAAWWALCLLVGIGKQCVPYFFGRVLTFTTHPYQAHHPRARRRGTCVAEMEVAFRFATASSHRKPYSPNRLRPCQDPGVGTRISKCNTPAHFCPAAGHRRVLHPVFDPRLPYPPTGHHRRHWNCPPDVEGTVGGYGSGRFME